MKLTIVIPLYIKDPLHLDFTRQTLATIKTKHDHDIILINNFCSPDFENDLALLAKPYTLPRRQAGLVANPHGNILASSWNLGIKFAFDDAYRRVDFVTQGSQGTPQRSRVEQKTYVERTRKLSDYCLILNNDILLHPQAIDNLVEFAGEHPEFLLWTSSEWSDARTLKDASWDGSFSLHPHFSAFMVSPKTIEVVGEFDENLGLAYFEDNDYHIRILLAGSQAAATTTSKFYHYGSRTTAVDDDIKVEAKYHYQLNRKYMEKKWGIDLHGRAFSPPEKILKEIYQSPFNNPIKSIKSW